MTNEVANESPEAKKAVFRRLVDIYAQAAVDTLEEFVAPDYVGHTAAGERDLAEFRKSIINFHAIFDKVATRMTAHVRMRETGEPVTMLGINLAIIRGGKIFEEWNTWELLQAPGQNENASAGPAAGNITHWGYCGVQIQGHGRKVPMFIGADIT